MGILIEVNSGYFKSNWLQGIFYYFTSGNGNVVVTCFLSKLTDRDNIAFRHLEQFENIIDPSTNSDLLHFSVPLVYLLPRNTESFYRCNGSLTSGDCNEDVTWTVFDTPIAISERQVITFFLSPFSRKCITFQNRFYF